MAGAVSLIIAAGAAMIYSLLHFGLWSLGMPGSGLMPAIASTMVVVASLWTVFSGDLGERPRFALPALGYCAGFVAILPLTAAIGLLPSLVLVGVAILRLIEGMTLLRASFVAVTVALGSWFLFERLLMVPLPHGALGIF